MPTPPNSPAAPKRHKAQTAPSAKQPVYSNRRGATTPHNIIPEIPAAKSPEVVKPVEPVKPVEQVTEKKSFFSRFFNK